MVGVPIFIIAHLFKVLSRLKIDKTRNTVFAMSINKISINWHKLFSLQRHLSIINQNASLKKCIKYKFKWWKSYFLTIFVKAAALLYPSIQAWKKRYGLSHRLYGSPVFGLLLSHWASAWVSTCGNTLFGYHISVTQVQQCSKGGLTNPAKCTWYWHIFVTFCLTDHISSTTLELYHFTQCQIKHL